MKENVDDDKQVVHDFTCMLYDDMRMFKEQFRRIGAIRNAAMVKRNTHSKNFVFSEGHGTLEVESYICIIYLEVMQYFIHEIKVLIFQL